jgi:hypothetical protein
MSIKLGLVTRAAGRIGEGTVPLKGSKAVRRWMWQPRVLGGPCSDHGGFSPLRLEAGPTFTAQKAEDWLFAVTSLLSL